MKYGDVLVRNRWYVKKHRCNTFRYRIDPVPDTGGSGYHFWNWYKNMRMYKRERSLFHEDGKYSRQRRSPSLLPNPWNDMLRSDIRTRNSWKNRNVKKQWSKYEKQ